MTSRSHHGVIALVGIGLMSLVLLPGCDNDDGQPPNQPPTIELTAGPMNGDSTAWNASFQWLGHDPDGLIDHYQYALDVPPDLMDAIDDSTASGIAWQTTTDLQGSFPFTTASPDSAYGTDGTPGPPTRYTGQNTFVIRAVDNDGGISRAEYVAFTALNYAPRTLLNEGRFESSDVSSWAWDCPPVVHWDTVDPETPSENSPEIAGYEFKLRQMPNVWNPTHRGLGELTEALAGIPWVPLPPDSSELKPATQSGYSYIFAVRALDRSGAREEVLIKGRNLIVAHASFFATGTPILTVRDRAIGTFQGPGPIWEAEIAAGTKLQFEMTGDAAGYGGEVGGYNYGVDVDPDSDDTGHGWDGWSLERLTDVIHLDEPGIHTLVFETRDSRDSGCGVTQLILVLRVIQMPFDRELLYVDDFRRSVTQGFRDADQDRRNREMLAAAGIDVNNAGTFGQFDVWGPSDQQGDPTILTLADLSPYRMVYWDVLGSSAADNSALLRANACPTGRVLQAYVAGGGALWVAGQVVFNAFGNRDRTCSGNLPFPPSPGDDISVFGSGDFICEFMGYCGGGILTVRSSPDLNGLAAAQATTEASTVGYPALAIDRVILPVWTTISFTDFSREPLFDATGGLDTLYVHRAGSPGSAADGKPNAFRYHDPNPVPGQGPVAVFGFPLFFLEQGSVEQGTGTFKAARVMVDWLRSEQQRFFEARGPGGGTASGGH